MFLKYALFVLGLWLLITLGVLFGSALDDLEKNDES